MVMDWGIRRLFMELFDASSSLVFRRMDEDKRNELRSFYHLLPGIPLLRDIVVLILPFRVQ